MKHPVTDGNEILLIKAFWGDERNQRGHKQMEKYTVFMDWKNQYCQNDYTTQSNL